MATFVVGSSVTAGQLKDFFRQIDDGSLGGKHIKALLEHRNPFEKPAVERVSFTVTGLGLTANEWKKRLESGGHKLSDFAKDILAKPDYDQHHRLEAGKEYKMVLVYGKEIRKDQQRTTANLKALACRELGEQAVQGLKGELALLIREKFTNAELEVMGLWYIAVLHDPIIDSDGYPGVLSVSRRGGCESWVGADCGHSVGSWDDCGAFAFFASA